MNETRNEQRPFRKMQGLGNDFVVFDSREDGFQLSAELASAVADRRTGIGCDQILTLLPSQKGDVFMRIQNADGSDAEASGNASRCIGLLITEENNNQCARVETIVGMIEANLKNGEIAVDMGQPSMKWQDIPLAEERDTRSVDIAFGRLQNPVVVNVGNPHVIFFVENFDGFNLEQLGPLIETYPLFPEGINVTAAVVTSDTALRLKVWERGTGLTRACGTAAVASVVAATVRGHLDRAAVVTQDGGSLQVDWRKDDHLVLTGPAETTYTGVIDLERLARMKMRK